MLPVNPKLCLAHLIQVTWAAFRRFDSRLGDKKRLVLWSSSVIVHYNSKQPLSLQPGLR